jgi:hypothetical protein
MDGRIRLHLHNILWESLDRTQSLSVQDTYRGFGTPLGGPSNGNRQRSLDGSLVFTQDCPVVGPNSLLFLQLQMVTGASVRFCTIPRMDSADEIPERGKAGCGH